MTEIKDRWKSVTNRPKWAARRASFGAKAQATKMVWFPPKPVDTGAKAGKKAASATRKATKKTTGAAKDTAGAAKKTGAAKKATGAAKKASNPLRAKKSSRA